MFFLFLFYAILKTKIYLLIAFHIKFKFGYYGLGRGEPSGKKDDLGKIATKSGPRGRLKLMALGPLHYYSNSLCFSIWSFTPSTNMH